MRVDLERHVGLGLAVGAGLIVIGAPDRGDQLGDAAQRAVFIEADDFVQRRFDHELELRRSAMRRVSMVSGRFGSKRALNSARMSAAIFGLVGERLFLHRLRGIEAGLLAIARQRADQSRFAPGARQRQDQPIEAVVLGLPVQIAAKACSNFLPARSRSIGLPSAERRFDVVHEDALRPGAAAPALQVQFEVHLGIDEQAHILEDRHRGRERQHIAARIEFAAHDVVARRPAGDRRARG